MITNEILHVGDRNKSQAISFLSTKLSWFRTTQITHVEIIPGPKVSKDELIEELRSSEKFFHSVKSVDDHIATIYVILK